MITEWERSHLTDGADNGHSIAAGAPTDDASAWLDTSAAPALPPGVRGERDGEGRYVLDGPVNPHAFGAIMVAVRHGGFRASVSSPLTSVAPPLATTSTRCSKFAASTLVLPDLQARLEACQYADYYMLSDHVKLQLTKELLANFTPVVTKFTARDDLCDRDPWLTVDERLAESTANSGSTESPPMAPSQLVEPPLPALPPVLDVTKLGLCRSNMVLERINLEGLSMRGLQLENSHIKRLFVRNCLLADCDLSMCVTANEVTISRSQLQSVKLSVFASKILIEDGCTLRKCNIRVVEELVVQECSLQECTFRGCEEDRKERHLISACFRCSEMDGDVIFPFDKVMIDRTRFGGNIMKMTKPGACVSFERTQLHLLPSFDGEGRIGVFLDECNVTKALHFKRMRLSLRGVHFVKACEMVDVEFPEMISEICFPRTSSFKQVKFRRGMQGCSASGCSFENCTLGYGQDVVSDCLLTRCTFKACHFPFLETDSPVANFSGSTFESCQVQWSGQFAHEENFVIHSCWLRKWNLSGCTVTDGNS
eukprot:TRINITY_DN50765_c0_g1_i1.p1 TRINITY_DN50765_c0_g1~~TRINITY_DN50765_c0_g1_i1.p1  ORF type:complete len:613 (+),score=87.36 TRINITY_DN50765_c0_g1_i1:225-1841(+)